MGADDEQQPEKRGFKVPSEKKRAERAAKNAELMSWREKYSDVSKIKFDDTRKAIYLNVLRKTGLRMRSAQAAGVTLQTVTNHIASDELFKIAREEALAEYADIIQQHAVKISVKGVKKPLLGGKDKDQIVAYEEVYATNILAMEMRRTNPEYKDRAEIDINQTGSVLVAPAEMTPAEWIKRQTEKNKAKKEPGADEK